MNEGRISVQTLEAASAGNSQLQTSALSAEMLTQSSNPSSMQASNLTAEILSQLNAESSLQFSSFALEVMQSVPRMNSQLLTVFN